ncbi:hypothetical protein HDR62_01430 [bacterium]|nr:hypothetical protein [bacterium]
MKIRAILMGLAAVLCLAACKDNKTEEILECYQPKNEDSPFYFSNEFSLGDSLPRFIEIFPDTFNKVESLRGGIISANISFLSLPWQVLASYKFSPQGTSITALDLSATHKSEYISDSMALIYRNAVLNFLKSKGIPKSVKNPDGTGMFKVTNVNQNVYQLKICNGCVFVFFSRGLKDPADPSSEVMYFPEFSAYMENEHTPSLLIHHPGLFD